MRLIKPSFEIIEQQAGLEGIYKQIERAGRVCYKSEDKITEDSAKPFVDRMIASGHGAMLEHGTVYLRYTPKDNKPLWTDKNDLESAKMWAFYSTSPYSRADENGENIYITTNYRVLQECNRLNDLKYLCEPTEYHAKRITVYFVCDRGVSHEFVRHRVFSFAQESTRYCNYSNKDKFGSEVTFIEPCWIKDNQDTYDRWCFYESLSKSEEVYFRLLEHGWKPQQARIALSNDLKTELVMTGFVDDWWGEYLVIDKSTGLIDQRIHGKFYDELNNIDRDKYRVVEKGFFPLRCSSGAHPQAQELAIPLREEFIKRKYYG